ncbi:MAG: SpoIIE family protein phosphatase [Clostridiales bacterium]|nr:SpoIIE family protein phosphatase [Clostridiales bacterium]
MKKHHTYLIAAVSALLSVLLIATGVLQRVDKWVQDTIYQQPGVASTDIVIIGIDEKALQELGPWPWSRSVVADALCVLASDPLHQPAVVALDILYAGESDEPGSDAYLANAAGLLENVVTASMAEYGEEIIWDEGHARSINASAVLDYITPYDALCTKTIQGHINAMLDRDGVLRHSLLYVEPSPDIRVYSLGYETARLFLQKQGKEIAAPPVNAAGHFYIPYTALPGTYYDGVSVADLINGSVPSSYWDGRIVLIGPYAPALQDAYFTSLSKAEPMYGVEFQANVIQSLINGMYKTEVPDLPQLIVLFILCLGAAFALNRMTVARGGILCAGIIILGIGASFIMYRAGLVTHPTWMPATFLLLYVVSIVLHYIHAARERQLLALKEERISAELSLATRIQSNALPKEFPPFPDRHEFDIYASMTPAKEVGGDLYDFFLIDDDHLCVVIGDVSGKGVPASLFMMVALTLIHHVAMHELSPARILQSINQEICSRNSEEMFVTIWLAVLEISTGRLTAANAGHEYPALKKADGHFDLFKDKHGFVIGGMDGVRFREYDIQMEKGDKLFVYTDGVPEATNAEDAFFGTDRMIEALRSGESHTPSEILDSVASAVHAFVGSAPQFDDLTMLCLTYFGPPSET